jgi:hypothetical protein
LIGKSTAAVVRRDGNKVGVAGFENQYEGGKLTNTEEIIQLATPTFGVYATSGDGAPDAGIVTTEQVNKILIPILCSGRYGFELDGYLSDGVPVFSLMLMKPDRVKYIGECEVNSFVCQQIDANTEFGFFSVYVDIQNNYAVRRIVSEQRQNSLELSGRAFFQNMPQVESFISVLDNIEFKLIDGVNVPTRGILQFTRKDKSGATFPSKSEFARENIDVNPVFGKDTFSAEFLKGEVVSNIDDFESRVVYIWDGEKAIPGYTMLEGTAFMQGYVGYIRLALMLAGIAMIAYALYRMLRKE